MLREIDRRADAAKVAREDVAADLIRGALEGAVAQIEQHDTPTGDAFSNAVWRDALTASNPNVRDVLLKIIGSA